jgi:hypothetical protein
MRLDTLKRIVLEEYRKNHPTVARFIIDYDALPDVVKETVEIIWKVRK